MPRTRGHHKSGCGDTVRTPRFGISQRSGNATPPETTLPRPDCSQAADPKNRATFVGRASENTLALCGTGVSPVFHGPSTGETPVLLGFAAKPPKHRRSGTRQRLPGFAASPPWALLRRTQRPSRLHSYKSAVGFKRIFTPCFICATFNAWSHAVSENR